MDAKCGWEEVQVGERNLDSRYPNFLGELEEREDDFVRFGENKKLHQNGLVCHGGRYIGKPSNIPSFPFRENFVERVRMSLSLKLLIYKWMEDIKEGERGEKMTWDERIWEDKMASRN